MQLDLSMIKENELHKSLSTQKNEEEPKLHVDMENLKTNDGQSTR